MDARADQWVVACHLLNLGVYCLWQRRTRVRLRYGAACGAGIPPDAAQISRSGEGDFLNVFDLAVVAVLLLSVIYAVYRGAVQTVLNVGALVLAVLLAYPMSKPMTTAVSDNTAITSQLLTFTDAVARVGDVELANTRVTGIRSDTIDQVITNVGLPQVMADILRRNLEGGASVESDMTVNDYVQQTVLSTAIRILCYLFSAAVLYLVLALLISLMNYIFHFPLVRGLDWLVAALFGLARGTVLSALLLLLAPLASTAIPLDAFRELLAGSALAARLMNPGFFTGIFFS